jgi:ribose transport system permease protein
VSIADLQGRGGGTAPLPRTMDEGSGLRTLLHRLPVETYVLSFTVALWIVLSFAAPNFLTEGNISNMMRQVSIAAIVAIGVLCTIVIAGIDLSVGSVVAFCGVLFAQLLLLGYGTPLAIGLTLLAGLAIGFGNAVAVAVLGIPAFIITLAGLQVYRGLALLLSGGMTVGRLPPGVKEFARGDVLGIPNLFLTMLAVALAVHYLLHFTRTGRYLYALGSNAEAARRQGIDTLRITITAYAISSGLAPWPGSSWSRGSAWPHPRWPTPMNCRLSPPRSWAAPACSADAAPCWVRWSVRCCSRP